MYLDFSIFVSYVAVFLATSVLSLICGSLYSVPCGAARLASLREHTMGIE